MIHWMKRFRRFGEDERGSSTVEFTLAAITFLTGFFWIFETGLIMTKQMMLERALDMTVRDLRLTASPLHTHELLKARVCDLALILDDCTDNLALELEVVTPGTNHAKTYKCVDKENNIAPVTTWNTGLRSEIVYLRACIRVDLLMPNGIALFPGVNEKGVPLVADSAFVNEPE